MKQGELARIENIEDLSECGKVGFMNARAEMNFEKIQENAYAGKIQEGFMYWWEEKVYYIQYTDEYYEYVFLSNDQDGRDSRLIVSHK